MKNDRTRLAADPPVVVFPDDPFAIQVDLTGTAVVVRGGTLTPPAAPAPPVHAPDVPVHESGVDGDGEVWHRTFDDYLWPVLQCVKYGGAVAVLGIVAWIVYNLFDLVDEVWANAETIGGGVVIALIAGFVVFARPRGGSVTRAAKRAATPPAPAAVPQPPEPKRMGPFSWLARDDGQRAPAPVATVTPGPEEPAGPQHKVNLLGFFDNLGRTDPDLEPGPRVWKSIAEEGVALHTDDVATKPATHAQRWAAKLRVDSHRQTTHLFGKGTGRKSKVCAVGSALEMDGMDPGADYTESLSAAFAMAKREGYSKRFLKKVMVGNDWEGKDFEKIARKVERHG